MGERRDCGLVLELFDPNTESAALLGGVEDGWLGFCSGWLCCALLVVTFCAFDKRFFLLASSAALKPRDFLGGARAPQPPPNLGRGSVEASVLDAVESSEEFAVA